MDVAVVFINIGEYHAARLKAANDSCRLRGWTLNAIQITNGTLEHAWGDVASKMQMPVKTILERKPDEPTDLNLPFSAQASRGLVDYLKESRYDAVLIPGWSFTVAMSALRWCRKNRKIAILASESNEFDAVRIWWREWIKRWRVRKFSSALVGGKSHADYLVKLGFDSNKIAFGYDVVDNDAFHPSRIDHLPNPCEKPYFLSVNRFVPKKNLLFLLKSYSKYRSECRGDPWDLVFCGSGPMQPEIDAQISKLQLTRFVHLPGFMKLDELLPYFAHASCFVHASVEEQWGLVVNEALAASLPVLVSNRCGCYEDLVLEGENGFGFDPTDSKMLADLMLRMHSAAVDLDAMGRSSLERSKSYPAARFGDGLVQAVEMGLPSTR